MKNLCLRKLNYIKHHRVWFISLAGVVIVGMASAVYFLQPKGIKTTEIYGVSQGEITKGENTASNPKILQTNTELTYLSTEITPTTKGANAAVLKWEQSGESEGATVELRTKNSGKWTNWYPASHPEDRKDDTPVPHSALVIGTDIEKIQNVTLAEIQSVAAKYLNQQQRSIVSLSPKK